jgi:hypothetical protein
MASLRKYVVVLQIIRIEVPVSVLRVHKYQMFPIFAPHANTTTFYPMNLPGFFI